MHYRATLAPFLAWGTIEGIAILNSKIKKPFLIGVLILIFPLFIQYYLHLPLNRLTKKYFWQKEEFMKNNRKLFSYIPERVSLVTQNNLVSHFSHRDEIYLLWPRKKVFEKENSPCGEKECWWLFWDDRPKYLVVDLHKGQTITHLLVNSEEELKSAIKNMETREILKMIKSEGESFLYEVKY